MINLQAWTLALKLLSSKEKADIHRMIVDEAENNEELRTALIAESLERIGDAILEFSDAQTASKENKATEDGPVDKEYHVIISANEPGHGMVTRRYGVDAHCEACAVKAVIESLGGTDKVPFGAKINVVEAAKDT